MKIQLGSHKNINSVNVDNHQIIQLENKLINFEDYELNLFANSSQIFEDEYSNSEIYRLYGSLEYHSILNGLEIKDNYIKEDLFKPFHSINDYSIEYKDIFNSFDIYVVTPTDKNINLDKNIYVRQFEVLGEANDFIVQNVGYDNNVFGDVGYYYQTNEDINLKYFDIDDEMIKLKYESYVDANNTGKTYNYPITELFLYFKYKPLSIEDVFYNDWGDDYTSPTKQDLSGNTLNLSGGTTLVYGDVIEINPNNFSKTVIKEQEFFLGLPVDGVTLRHRYNPFLPIKIKRFGNELYKENINNSSYTDINKIPDYAFNIDDSGNYVWRELDDTSTYISENNVVNRPFINNKKYIFKTLLLSILPDLTHPPTKELFNEIINDNKFDFINNKPTDDLDKLGKSC